MLKLFFMLSFSVLLFAQDFAELYRSKGIEEVQKQLDLAFIDKEYWQRQLENTDTQFGYFEDINVILSCDKNSSKLSAYHRNGKNEFVLLTEYDAYTGKATGDKKREGDLKTPVGIYQITKKLDKVDPFYGPLAFVTSYPNLYDRVRGKNGSGIWIHGLPLNAEREAYTRGCIAIENGDIVCIDQNISIDKTLLVIEEKRSIQADRESLVALLSELYRWRYAWLNNELENYLSFYRSDFTRYDGTRIEEFKAHKTKVFSFNDEKTIIFNNISILPYPGDEKSLYTIMFDETYQSKRYSFKGPKVLMVTLDDDKKMKIIAEQ